jgi:hypothetical protein
MKSHKLYYFIVSIFLTLALMFAGQSLAANIDAKLPDNNNTSSFQVKDSANKVLMKVQSGGNVGIGTAAPQTKLHAVGTSWFQGDNTPLPAAAGKGIAIGSGGNFGYLFAFDYGNWAPQNLVLNHPGGNVGIGTSTPNLGRLHVEGGSTTAVYGGGTYIGVEGRSYVNGGVGVLGRSFGNTGYGVYGEGLAGSWAGFFNGNVYVTGTLTQNSDVRLKQGVRNLGYGLHDVMQLRPVSYNWKQTSDGREQIGLLAQEVEAVVPELVTTAHDADQTKGINYIGLLPVMIKAMQEQQDIITTLYARVKALEQSLQQSRIQQQGD